MKKYFLVCLAIVTILILASLAPQSENTVQVISKDTKLPDWQWTSGEVEMEKTAAKQCFAISFTPQIYHPRDSVRIIFTSYKVALTNVNGASFKTWTGRVNFDYFINTNWIPIVADTNDLINRPFSGKNNVTEDSLVKYTILTTVPISRTLTFTTSVISISMDNKLASPILSSGKLGVTLTTSIRGIEVQKIVRE
jgi:hypothetical protein